MNSFLFRFDTKELKKDFKIIALNQDKSMNCLINEILSKFVKENRVS
jgi:predicted HicB family RNase H-like nuclease